VWGSLVGVVTSFMNLKRRDAVSTLAIPSQRLAGLSSLLRGEKIGQQIQERTVILTFKVPTTNVLNVQR